MNPLSTLPWGPLTEVLGCKYSRPRLTVKDTKVQKIDLPQGHNEGTWICAQILIWGLPGGSACKESACNVGDLGSIPGLERSPGGGHGNPLQYSCLENPHGQKSLSMQVAKSLHD